MCGFTLIRYLECGCESISTTATNTQLCDMAKLSHLVQGTDCAPAACHPSNEIETIIVAKQEFVGPCEDCHLPQVEVKRGGIQHVRQLHAHPSEFGAEQPGDFAASSTREWRELEAFIHKKMTEGEELVSTYGKFLSDDVDAMDRIVHTGFWNLFEPERGHFEQWYLNDLQECKDWMRSRMYSFRTIPKKLYEETYRYFRAKAERAAAMVDKVAEIAECLYGSEPSTRGWTGSESQLNLLLKLFGRFYPYIKADTSPQGFYLYDPEFQITPGTLEIFRIRQVARQAYNDMPMQPAVQAEDGRTGELNMKNLSISVPEGLLEDEPATNIVVEHIPFPESENWEKVEIEFEFGNKLIWDEHAKSPLSP